MGPWTTRWFACNSASNTTIILVGTWVCQLPNICLLRVLWEQTLAWPLFFSLLAPCLLVDDVLPDCLPLSKCSSDESSACTRHVGGWFRDGLDKRGWLSLCIIRSILERRQQSLIPKVPNNVIIFLLTKSVLWLLILYLFFSFIGWHANSVLCTLIDICGIDSVFVSCWQWSMFPLERRRRHRRHRRHDISKAIAYIQQFIFMVL